MFVLGKLKKKKYKNIIVDEKKTANETKQKQKKKEEEKRETFFFFFWNQLVERKFINTQMYTLSKHKRAKERRLILLFMFCISKKLEDWNNGKTVVF